MATTETPRIDTTRITAFRADLDVRHRGATLGDGQQVARPLALILDGRVVIEGTVAELRQLLLDSLQQLEIAEITALLAAVSHWRHIASSPTPPEDTMTITTPESPTTTTPRQRAFLT